MMAVIRREGGDERGSVTVFTALTMTSLVLALALMVGFACLFAQKSALDNDLQLAREETLANGFQMELKNSEDPGRLISNKVCASLRRNGYEGAFAMQFYEATRSEIRAACPSLSDEDVDKVRALAYQVVLTQGAFEVIPGLSLLNGFPDELVVASGIACDLCPYSLFKTYRPGEDPEAPNYSEGVLYLYTVSSSGETSLASVGKDEMTSGMRAAVQAACGQPESLLAGN